MSVVGKKDNPQVSRKDVFLAKCNSSVLYRSGGGDSDMTIKLFNPLDETYKPLYTDTGHSGTLICVRNELFYIRAPETCVASIADSQVPLNLKFKGTIQGVYLGPYSLCFPVLYSNKEAVWRKSCGRFRFYPATMEFSQVVLPSL